MLPVSCHTPWLSWTLGLTGWTDQEILTLVARPEFCYQGETCTITNWKRTWLHSKRQIACRRVQRSPRQDLPHIWPSQCPARVFKQLTAIWSVHGGIPQAQIWFWICKEREERLKLCPTRGDLPHSRQIKTSIWILFILNESTDNCEQSSYVLILVSDADSSGSVEPALPGERKHWLPF